jgi:hypothetical protein
LRLKRPRLNLRDGLRTKRGTRQIDGLRHQLGPGVERRAGQPANEHKQKRE